MSANTKPADKAATDAKTKAANKAATGTNTDPTHNPNTSAITSDATAPAGDIELNLSNARISIPADSIPAPAREETPEANTEPETDNSFFGRAAAAGIGLIKVDGYGFSYVGVSPQRDKKPVTDTGIAVSGANSTFTPLQEVPFNPSTRVKDPASGKFYYPQAGMTSWESVNLGGAKLVPDAK